MKLAIIGRTQLLYDTAVALHRAGHEIGCVVTAPAAPEYSRSAADFEVLARSLGAKFIASNGRLDAQFDESCRGLDLGISVNWTSVLSRQHLELFRLGVLNAHHGDLPMYRGNACANWALLRGEPSITATIHVMEPDVLDSGRVICQERYAVGPSTTITDVYRWSETSTPALFATAVDLLAANPAFALKVADPNGSQAFRCYPRIPEDGFIDWTHPPQHTDALIRASCEPFVGAYTFHWADRRARKLRVLESRIVAERTNDLAVAGHVLHNDRETGESLVRCGEGVLALVRCRYDDEADMFAPGRRWTSIRMRLGIRAEDWLWQLQQSRAE